MTATLTEPTGDLGLLRALLLNPTLSVSEAAKLAGVAVPPVALDDEPADGGGDDDE